MAVHSASLHVVTLQSHDVGGLLATCPAHAHLLIACAFTHSRTLQACANSVAFLVVRRIQCTHSSSSSRHAPTILRSIARLALSRDRNSSARGVHDWQPHKAQLETVRSNSLRRRLTEILWLTSNPFIDQNSFHPAATLFCISFAVTSASVKIVPRIFRPSASGSTSSAKSSSIGTVPLRVAFAEFVCALHFDGCSLSPRFANAVLSVSTIRFREVQLLAKSDMSSANATCVIRLPSNVFPTSVP